MLSEAEVQANELSKALLSSQKLVEWTLSRLHGLEISRANATLIPGLLLDLCIEHHAGIVQMVTMKMYGSSYALLRPQFEALVRALWLNLFATDDQLRLFVERDALPKVGVMLSAIEGHPDFESSVLAWLGRDGWNSMCGYTHGGMHQLARRADGANIEPQYAPNEIVEVIKAAGTFALIALLQIARIAKNAGLAKEISDMMNGDIPSALASSLRTN